MYDNVLFYVNPVTEHVYSLVLSEINLFEEARLNGISGYRSVSKCRPNSHGGDIFVLCKNELKPKKIDLGLHLNSAEFMFFIKEIVGEKKLLL